MAGSRRPWMAEDNQRLKDLWARRVPLRDISLELDRSVMAINNQRTRLGLPTRNYRCEPGAEKVEENSVRVYLPLSYMQALEGLSESTGKSKSSIVRDLVGTLVARREAA